MLYLAAALASQTVFAQSYKYSLWRRYNVDWVSFSSFAFSAVFVAFTVIVSGARPSSETLWVGVAYGIAGSMAQVTFFRALRYGALSISMTIVHLSMLLPVLASILLWGERPTALQAGAIAGVVIAIALMGNVELRRVQSPAAWSAWLAMSYLFSGLGGVFMKLFKDVSPAGQEPVFLLVSYLVSVLSTWPLIRGGQPSKQELVVGCVRGVAILLANFLLLRAVGVLPGYLVFAVYGVAGVLLNILWSVILWQERIKGRAASGVIIAIAAIVILNL